MKNAVSYIMLLLPIIAIGQSCHIYRSNDIVLYNSMPNPIEIDIDNLGCGKYYVTTDNGSIKSNDCKYIVYPEKCGEETISVFKNNGKLITKKTFRVEEMIVEAYVAGFDAGVTEKYIKNVPSFSKRSGLEIKVRDLVCWDSGAGNLKYEMVVIKKTNQIIRIQSEKSKFSEEIHNELEKLESGDILMFHNIVFQFGKNEIPLKDLVFETL
ncbi:hypothetical protein HYN48_13665 [Flavobacterium magnum]|uniref:Gliding motility-associated protein GldM second immunoglobulin-like domain-containing protein n=1 Tax=Flavobacterium magnum TaxID=2162713 RepID=A0A2S0RHB2_9FLAO|nr:GldM family protein [Flavobacterium magnum]AWA31046.1 hypothetical protein HYN48_13665 [Flavobacterium magnum]